MISVTWVVGLGVVAVCAIALAIVAATRGAARLNGQPQGDGRTNPTQARAMREAFGMPEPAEDSDVQGGYCTPTKGGGVAWNRYRSRRSSAAAEAGQSGHGASGVVINNNNYGGGYQPPTEHGWEPEPATERAGMGREPARLGKSAPPADIHTRPEEVAPRREERRPPKKQPKAPRLDPNAGQGKIKILFPIAGIEYRIFPRTMEQNPQRQTGEKNEKFGQLASGVSELEIEEASLFPGEWGVEYRDAQGNVSRFWKFTVN